jgi:asparagine synthase (glutamine-hydrolysing)
MSAVGGVVSLDGAPVDEHRLDPMVAALEHLPAERVGRWHGNGAALFQLAFPTTPQADRERQPLIDDPSRTVVVFDGRLDNRDELLRELRAPALGEASPDCEIVRALFARHGRDCPLRMVGDYALAVWQPGERRLFCARSPVGWRPLLWHRSPHVFAFATDVTALIKGLALERRPNEGALAEFLSVRFMTQTETLWRDVYRLPPGAALEVASGTVRSWHWHTGPFAEETGTDAELAERLLALIDQAVAACMRSSTAVAAQLSGGLDSSTVVCRAAQLRRTGRVERQIRPITVRFPGEAHDESEFSRAVDEVTGIESLEARPAPFSWDRARAWSERTLHLPLRPNVVSVVLPTFARAREQGARVLLTGEGGDDWLAGTTAHWPDLIARGRLAQVWREAVTQTSGPPAQRLRLLGGSGFLPLVSRSSRAQIERPNLDYSAVVPDWIRPEWAARVGLSERWRADAPPIRLPSIAQRSRFFRYTLARSHINMDNAVTAAAQLGVELRHPLHDRRLTEFLVGVPGAALRRNGVRKHLLRDAMRGSLPEKVRTRPGKAMFHMPIISALDELFAATSVRDLQPVRMGWVDATRMEAIVATWRAWYASGRRERPPEENIAAVWFTVSAHVWLEQAARA